MAQPHAIEFPLDPLIIVSGGMDSEYRRRTVEGILESYHSNYDVLAESIQNAVDAVEDAKLAGMKAPYLIEVTVNLSENWIGVLDTGIGMSPVEVTSAFAPHISFKQKSEVNAKRDKKSPYRGYKGVGLTFLAYGTDEIVIHSKQNDVITKARMKYGRAWATGERPEPALMVAELGSSPLDSHSRGTYVQVQFGATTRPRSLSKLANTTALWSTILRTKTAIGQVLLGRKAVVPIKVKLVLQEGQKTDSIDVEPEFLYPHEVKRKPEFRFLDLVDYHTKYAEQTSPPADKLRQDGVYLIWDTEKIKKELTEAQKTDYAEHVKKYSPYLYAFVPYQASIWADVNFLATGISRRTYLNSGLVLAVNRQRQAETLDIYATRYEAFSRNVFVLVHLDGAKPDQGRKTIEADAEEFAQKAADRVVQYLAKQRDLLRPPGESPTPGQRQVEKDHGDWIFNVKTHAKTEPLHAPPVTYVSKPLTEQDVVGLFNQLTSLGVFAGIRVYATSQSKTYDCLIEYDVQRDHAGLLYVSGEENPLGVSPYTLGDQKRFSTKQLTVEFKNNLDALIDDVEGESPKTFGNIDICICWATVGKQFKGFELDVITETNLDERKFPGVTHLLRKDGDSHVISVVMLSAVMDMIGAGKLAIPVGGNPSSGNAVPASSKAVSANKKRRQ